MATLNMVASAASGFVTTSGVVGTTSTSNSSARTIAFFPRDTNNNRSSARLSVVRASEEEDAPAPAPVATTAETEAPKPPPIDPKRGAEEFLCRVRKGLNL